MDDDFLKNLKGVKLVNGRPEDKLTFFERRLYRVVTFIRDLIIISHYTLTKQHLSNISFLVGVVLIDICYDERPDWIDELLRTDRCTRDIAREYFNDSREQP